MLFCEMLRVRKQFTEAAQRFINTAQQRVLIPLTMLLKLIFFKSYAKDQIGAAFLYEQAAFCYLFTPRPLLRKFALQLIIAGNQFEQTNQVFIPLQRFRLFCLSHQFLIFEYSFINS